MHLTYVKFIECPETLLKWFCVFVPKTVQRDFERQSKATISARDKMRMHNLVKAVAGG